MDHVRSMALDLRAIFLFMKCKAGTDGKFAGNLNGKDIQ